ncbi:MAG: UDP-N-acetylmuramoyl-L-alanyl-D-glutamate--2,6-diaminopimelate ligase [Candidatus Omnitrophota bacterium]|nr:MAG: UDP-N-acetylmuramoyl-L-alanyl-D-glutamate--2,6-diaminopimelate ligase [Candidatus Omnitrophota bacterium]
MKIKDIFPKLNLESKAGELEVKGISNDSRFIKRGDVFFVIEGKNFDIFSVLGGIEDKAAAFVCAGKNKQRITATVKRKPIILVRDIQQRFLKAVDIFYGVNKNNIKFIGVTGTNGKTTTTHFIYQFLKKADKEVSLIGTVNYLIAGNVYNSSHTTPDYLSLRKMLKRLDSKEPQFIVMEVSSHGIDQRRIEGVDFQSCLFTNLTRDHLDYHKTMTDYFNTKKKLFIDNKKSKAIINIDDPWGRRLLKEVRGAFVYAIERRADLAACNIRLTKEGTGFQLLYKGKSQVVKTSVLGVHNVSNILAATAAFLSLGFSFDKAVEFIPSLKGVKGRLEKAAADIFIDYAHTPDALEKALSVLRQVGYENIISVFGCGGDRDKGKRLLMGRVSSKFCRFSVITSDNPRTEDPSKICSQITAGFKNKNYMVVIDRKEAIKRAVSIKNKYKRCCVLIAGKGHEDCQIIGQSKIAFSDSETVKELVKR